MSVVKFKKSTLFKSLVVCSVLAIVLLLFNTSNISWQRKPRQQQGDGGGDRPDSENGLKNIINVNVKSEEAEPQSRQENEVLDLQQDEGKALPDLLDLPRDEIGPDEAFVNNENPDGKEEESKIENVEALEPKVVIPIPTRKDDPDPGNELEPEVPRQKEEIGSELQVEQAKDPEQMNIMKEKEQALSFEKDAIADSFLSLGSNEPNIDLEKLQLSNGGKPLRNVIFTVWGVGSGFIGDAVATHPATFYHHDPLKNLGPERLELKSQLEVDALKSLKSLLSCNYSDAGNLVKYFSNSENMHRKNTRLWTQCKKNMILCQDSQFLSEMCKIFPHQLMKVARVSLKTSDALLEDEYMDVKVLHIVRDPRGILPYRKGKNWCDEKETCRDPAKLCKNMVDDYHAALDLKEKYPDTFLALRYEDILLQLQLGFEVLLHHFRLQFHSDIHSFLDTQINESAFKEFNATLLNWIDYFKENSRMEALKTVQDDCKEALDLWGYAQYPFESPTEDFQSLLEPPWSEMRLV